MASRRRQPTSNPIHLVPPGTREINAGSVLEKPVFETKTRMTVSRAIALTGIAVQSALPAFLSWGLTMGLIFGGCCSNVFALEAIVKEEPESGILITFVQFVVTTLFTMPPYISVSRPSIFLKARAVPLSRWLPSTLMFFTVNIMNNFAFGYNISVPVHIILRSGGSVTTMLVGFAWGKRYSKAQVFGVGMLTVGVIIAAMADADAKGKMASDPSGAFENPAASFATGLAILFIAQLLSAVMGLYVQNTYAIYGAHWHENLFYSHILSLPLFAAFYPVLRQQLRSLLNSDPIKLALPFNTQSHRTLTSLGNWREYISSSQNMKFDPDFSLRVPKHVVTLVLNSLTQYACIRGVNLLGARTSALGVTIVLNVRKLVSLFASIWLFDNDLPMGVLIGATVVFIGAAVYSWGGASGSKAALTNNRKVKGGE